MSGTLPASFFLSTHRGSAPAACWVPHPTPDQQKVLSRGGLVLGFTEKIPHENGNLGIYCTRYWYIFRHTQKPPIKKTRNEEIQYKKSTARNGGYLIFGEGIIQIDDKEYPSYWSKWRLRTNSGLTLPWWALHCNWMCSPRVSKLTHTEDGVWTSWSDDHSGNWSMIHGIASVGRLADSVMLATAAS